MEKFLLDLQSPYWWVSIVLVGICINVLSDSIKKFMSRRFLVAIGEAKGYLNLYSKIDAESVAILKDSKHYQYVLLFDEMKFNHAAYARGLEGLITLIIGYYMWSTYPEQSSTIYLTGILSVYCYTYAHVNFKKSRKIRWMLASAELYDPSYLKLMTSYSGINMTGFEMSDEKGEPQSSRKKKNQKTRRKRNR